MTVDKLVNDEMNLKPNQVLYKRLLDIFLSIVGLILSFPVLGLLLIITSINTKLTGPYSNKKE